MEDTIMNSVVPAAIVDLESKSRVKDEPKLDDELEPETGGRCFDVLDMVEEPFDETSVNYYSSDDDEADKTFSNCDSSSECGSTSRRMETADGSDRATYSQSVPTEDDIEMDEVFETIDGNPEDYEECYVAERPPSPPSNPLPRGWKQVYHESGATIFVQLETNVCSLSRPYFLGTRSTKFHTLPTSPVPCLSYRSRQLDDIDNVAAYTAACKSTVTTSSASRPIFDANAGTCPASSPIPPADAAISDANDVSCGVNIITPSENPTYADLSLCTCPVRLATSMYTENALNTPNVVTSDADLIMYNANVTTFNSSGATTDTNAIISDSNPGACPVSAASYTENAVSSDGNEIMADVNVTISKAKSHTCPIHATTYNKSSTNAAANSVTSGANAATLATGAAIYPAALISSTTTSAASKAVATSATPCMGDVKASTSNAAPPDEDMITPTSLMDDLTASTSNAAPPDEDMITPTSLMDDLTASTFSAAVPDKDTICTSLIKNETASTSNAASPGETTITPTSPIDDETALPYNDTIVDSDPKAEEAKLLEYCKQLFKFKKIKYLKFRSWDVRRTYLRALRNERNRRRCPFSNNKFVSFPIETKDDEGNMVSTMKWIINPRGRSYVAILHEYLQQSKKTQPEYKFTEVDNARNPYAATVVVNGTEYGTGFGMSKKEAKFEAAKATLEVLLPKMMKYVLSVCCDKSGNKKDEDCSDNDDDLQNVASAFDDIEITDPRVTELSLQTTEPKPYELLLNCLQKKGEQREVKFDFQAESMESKMSVGEDKVTVKCANKREGKQLAAQAMLQLLHPHIKNWGSLLRLYGNYMTNQYRQVSDDKDVEDLKSKPANTELLDILRRRMSNLSERETEGAQFSSEQR